MATASLDFKPPYLPFVDKSQPAAPPAANPLFPPAILPPAELLDLYYHQGVDVDGQAIDPVTRNLCIVALTAVGRCDWSQTSDGLAHVEAGVYEWDPPVCCWASCVRWAGIASALTHQEVSGFYKQLRAAHGVGGETAVAKAILWDGLERTIGRTAWQPGAVMPLGAMVYLSTDTSNLYHVGLHVGQGLVVGACSPEPSPFVNALMANGHSPFTTVQPIERIWMRPEWTSYTNEAFWKGWPSS